jgi:endonuclease/exonuclease/phosphatase family metal-dependent hydrolase
MAGAPAEPRRWLAVQVEPSGPAICLVHVPNMVTGRKWPFLAAISCVLEAWTLGPAILLGDTNCGWPGLDEETAVFGKKTGDWLDSVEALGWRDTFRYLRPGERTFTWYSPNAGNGFRIDQAFVNDALLARAAGASYAWGGAAGGRRETLSDHAALLLDLEGEPAAGLPGVPVKNFESGTAGAAPFGIRTSADQRAPI